MQMRRLSTLLLGLTLPLAAFAAAYPDVPEDASESDAIYGLQRMNIMRGNDDGTFGWDRVLNRAELMALVYRAMDLEVRPVLAGCMPDLPVEAWFSATICTAVEDGYVQGYPDGLFRPGQEVNNVEALKIILNVLGFAVPELTQEDRLGLDLIGVTHGSWYAPFLHRGIVTNVLPAVLIENNRFDPGGSLKRQHAAMMIWSAITIPEPERKEIPADQAKILEEEHMEQEQQALDDEVTPTGAILSNFPLHRTGQTGERGATAFSFSLDAPGTVLVEARNMTSDTAGIKCFLYLLGESGFSSEFFLGYEEGGSCWIRAALRAGSYQVEIRSPSEGAEYSLDVTETSGDGNDGFIEAIALSTGVPRQGTLKEHDYEDWYKFVVPRQEPHRVKLTSGSDLSCMLFPADNVDLSSFSTPKCGETADYDPGTWYISVKKSDGAEESQSYTIELR